MGRMQLYSTAVVPIAMLALVPVAVGALAPGVYESGPAQKGATYLQIKVGPPNVAGPSAVLTAATFQIPERCTKVSKTKLVEASAALDAPIAADGVFTQTVHISASTTTISGRFAGGHATATVHDRGPVRNLGTCKGSRTFRLTWALR
jgi:hypothetical protein